MQRSPVVLVPVSVMAALAALALTPGCGSSSGTRCTTSTECDDLDPCTTNECTPDGCTYAAIPGCAPRCDVTADCVDDDPCTIDVCTIDAFTDEGTCSNVRDPSLPGCGCATDAECDDSDACTTDTCSAGSCTHQPSTAPECSPADAREAVVVVAAVRTCSDLDTCSASEGAAANVVVADEALSSHCVAVGGANVCTGVTTFTSEQGPPVIDLDTSIVQADATYDGASSRYEITGLTGASPFAPSGDTLTVTGTPPGASAPVVVTVAPPAPVPFGASLGEPAGLATELRHADGGFDAFYVQLDLAGGGSVSRFVAREDAPLVAGDRVISLLAPETITHLESESLDVTGVRVAFANVAPTSTLFPGFEVPVMAARMAQIPPGALVPATGGTVVRQCSELPATFPEDEAIGSGFFVSTMVVCIPPAECSVSNDTFEDSPPRTGQCFGADRALVAGYQGSGAPSAQAGSAFSVVAADAPVSATVALEPETDHTIVVERTSTGERYGIALRAGTAGYDVTSVGTHSGPLPQYGALYPCESLPVDLTGGPISGSDTIPARVCIQDFPARCSVDGHLEATPESEPACLQYALELRESATGAIATTQGWWVIVSATAGTITDGGYTLTGFPSGSDVTVDLSDGTITASVAFRHLAPGYRVLSVTR